MAPVIFKRTPPLSDLQARPADLTIRIRGSSGCPDLEMFAADLYRPKPLGITLADLTTIHEQLVRNVTPFTRATSPELDGGAARDLAKAGHHAYLSVFPDDARRFIASALADKSASISFVYETACLPWELLYPAEIEERVDWTEFWGFRHQVYRMPCGGPEREASPPVEITYETRPAVALLFDEQLAAVREEVTFYENLRGQGLIDLSTLDALDPAAKPQSETRLKNFLGGDTHVVHLACHAEHSQHADLDHLRVRKGYHISRQFLSDEIHLRANPLVLLNACRSAGTDPQHMCNFARAFLCRGARGVVATECMVGDSLAALLGKKLAGKLVPGQAVGPALLQTRLDILNQLGSPIGLAYAAYDRPTVRLQRRRSPHAQEGKPH